MQSHEERAAEALRSMGGVLSVPTQQTVLRRMILAEDAVDEYQADVERLTAENGRMKRALQTITSSQFKGRDWPEVYDRLLALAYEGLGTDKEQPATSV